MVAAEKQLSTVEIDTLIPGPFARFFEAKASVEAVRDVYISPETSGQIKTVEVDRGDRVRKGQLLMSLNTDIVRSSIEEVETSLELATRIFEKQQQLWDQEIGSEIQYLEAKNAKESLEARLSTLESQLEMAYIRAPFQGIVDDVMVKTGELASPGMRLLRLVDLEDMRVTAEISEAFLSSVKVGDPVRLSFPSYSDLQMEVNIDRIGMVINPDTRTFTVEVLIRNRAELLKPNMLASMLIQDYFEESALTVPSIILKDDFRGTFLFRLRQEDQKHLAEKVYVSTGVTVQDATSITGGLSGGDLIIVKGYKQVSDGEAVSVMQ